MREPESPADLEQRYADVSSAIIVREYTLRTMPLTPRLRRAISEHVTALRVQLRLLEMRRHSDDFLF